MDDHINAARAERRKVIKALAAEFAGSAEAEALEAARTANWKEIVKEHYPDNVPEDVEQSYKDTWADNKTKVVVEWKAKRKAAAAKAAADEAAKINEAAAAAADEAAAAKQDCPASQMT